MAASKKKLKRLLVKEIGVPNKEARDLIEDNLINVRLLPTKLAKEKRFKKKKIDEVKPVGENITYFCEMSTEYKKT